jgi:hypothetical protein
MATRKKPATRKKLSKISKRLNSKTSTTVKTAEKKSKITGKKTKTTKKVKIR